MEKNEHPQIDRPANSTTDRPIRKPVRFMVAGVALGLGALVHLGGENELGAREGIGEVAARAVDVAKVEAAADFRDVRFSGLVRARQRARLGFTLSGRLMKRPAQIGARVKKGALLAELDTAPLRHAQRAAQARLRDAETQLGQLERDLARAERLFAKKAGVEEAVEKTRAARDATRARREALVAQLAESDRQLREARLTAPFDGTVLDVLTEPGETTRPGAPVVILSAEDQLEVEVHVPERVRAGLELGAEAQVELPLAGQEELRGRVAQLGRAAAGAGSLFPVVVALDGAPNMVVPGFTADVRLPVKRAAGLLVPVPAVSDPGGRAPFVYRVEDSIARRVPVKVLELTERGVVVQSKLQIGDPVVVRGHASLLPGEPVEVRR